MVLSALLALVAGLAQACALADPWTRTPHSWLQIVSLAVLVGLLSRAGTTWRRGFALAWLFGLAWLTGTLWWLFIAMHRYGGLNAGLAVLAVLALTGALALFYGAVGALFVGLAKHGAPLRNATVFAALWTLAELVRGQWLSGFPWGAGGYAHVNGGLAGYAPWVGVYGIGCATAWIAAGLASFFVAGMRGSRGLALLVIIVAAVLWGGLPYGLSLAMRSAVPEARAAADPPITVALLQGNIPQDEKFVPGTGIAQSLDWYGAQFQRSTAALVIAPETAIPLLPDQLPDGYWAALSARFGQGDQALLAGVPQGSLAAGYTNSVIGFAAGQAPSYRYDKHHLVPFGEFIPPLFKRFVRMMNIPLGDFNRGPLVQPSLTWHGERFAPTICYEDLFGEELAARFADAAAAPTALVNISNLGWFGDTVALDQHLAISRMRALEFARPILRATNTGATAIIDAQGRVTQALPYATRGVLTGQIKGQTRITPYAWWVSRYGLWPLWGVCVVIVAAGFMTRRTNR
jgi:apolipoprotein N-acyltransferase